MKQIEDDQSIIQLVRERERKESPKKFKNKHSLKESRCSSAISKMHSRHLLGRGYNEIIAKISEEQNKIRSKFMNKNRKNTFGGYFNA